MASAPVVAWQIHVNCYCFRTSGKKRVEGAAHAEADLRCVHLNSGAFNPPSDMRGPVWIFTKAMEARNRTTGGEVQPWRRGRAWVLGMPVAYSGRGLRQQQRDPPCCPSQS